jgi:hypothetical protein
MKTAQTTRRDLTRIRDYLQNGFPQEYKDQLRGEQRRLEYRLEKEEYLAREARN